MIRVELTPFSPNESNILDIRFKVFVNEQGVDPKLEVDGRDSDCLHAIAFDNDKPVGTGRLLPDGHIGRMAVLKEYRSKGIGRLILLRLIEAARQKSWDQVHLSSQTQAVPFYEKFGFKRFGKVYLEAGIDHVDMRLDLQQRTLQPFQSIHSRSSRLEHFVPQISIPMKRVEPLELRESDTAHPNRVILDVLPGETFEKRHIENALNACIYEIDFLEKAEALIPEKAQAIIVYGQNDRFEAAPLAFEKLQSNGWTNVAILKGGIEQWERLGYPTEGKGEPSEPLSGTFEASTEKSVVRWVGRNLLNQHNGVVGLEKAILELEQDRLVGGEAVMDMNRIECQDIEDPSMAQMLIGHLRTEDFFLVDQYPTARFEVSSAEEIPNAPAGSPNYNVEGKFTLRGHTEKIRFVATLGKNDEVVALQASFDIDRVLWNSKYGSGKIYEALGKHVVNDLISINFQLIAPFRQELQIPLTKPDQHLCESKR